MKRLLIGLIRRGEKVPTIYVRAGTKLVLSGPIARSMVIEVVPDGG